MSIGRGVRCCDFSDSIIGDMSDAPLRRACSICRRIGDGDHIKNLILPASPVHFELRDLT